MAVLKTQSSESITGGNNLFNDYYWFYSNIYNKLQKASDEFFQEEFQLKFISISFEDNVLLYGDEYFVNKIPVNKTTSIIMKISSNLVSSLLDSAIGASETSFKLKKLTDIEAMLIKSFTVFAYKNIENFLNKTEVSKKIIQSSRNYNLTFFVKQGKKHTGKIILTIPSYLLPEIVPVKNSDKFSISDFKTAKALLTISAGYAKIALNEVKALEEGDIIVLDNSDINKMSVMRDNVEVIKFKINPNPSLIISIDKTGDEEMEEQTGLNPQNMWDSILVDIIAEFDNVKLTLGELKQISEGLVIDLGSVYENKIKLRVENQIVASGELVILNDRYGVRIDNVKKSKEETVKPAPARNTAPPEAKKPAPAKPAAGVKPAQRPAAPGARPAVPAAKRPVKPAAAPAQNPNPKAAGDENFDYSDFEIEDESI